MIVSSANACETCLAPTLILRLSAQATRTSHLMRTGVVAAGSPHGVHCQSRQDAGGTMLVATDRNRRRMRRTHAAPRADEREPPLVLHAQQQPLAAYASRVPLGNEPTPQCPFPPREGGRGLGATSHPPWPAPRSAGESPRWSAPSRNSSSPPASYCAPSYAAPSVRAA